MTEPTNKCSTCGMDYITQNLVMCDFFGIENPRLVYTGFVLFDPVANADTPDLDSCDRADCPGKKEDTMAVAQDFVKTATGKGLESLAKMYGVPRKRHLWLFPERDVNLRKRVLDRVRAPTRVDLKKEYLEHQFRVFLWRAGASILAGVAGLAMLWFWGRYD